MTARRWLVMVFGSLILACAGCAGSGGTPTNAAAPGAAGTSSPRPSGSGSPAASGPPTTSAQLCDRLPPDGTALAQALGASGSLQKAPPPGQQPKGLSACLVRTSSGGLVASFGLQRLPRHPGPRHRPYQGPPGSRPGRLPGPPYAVLHAAGMTVRLRLVTVEQSPPSASPSQPPPSPRPAPRWTVGKLLRRFSPRHQLLDILGQGGRTALIAQIGPFPAGVAAVHIDATSLATLLRALLG